LVRQIFVERQCIEPAKPRPEQAMDIEGLTSDTGLALELRRHLYERSLIGPYVRRPDDPVAVAQYAEGDIDIVGRVVGDLGAQPAADGKEGAVRSDGRARVGFELLDPLLQPPIERFGRGGR